MRKSLPASTPHYWLSRLDDTQRQTCLFTGTGGWATALAWNPNAQFVTHPGQTFSVSRLSDFVTQQRLLGRKILGYLSYDLGCQLHNITQTAQDDLGLPLAYFLAFDNYIELTADATIVHYKEQSFLDEMLALKARQNPGADVVPAHSFSPTLLRKQYDQSFQTIKRYILDGDAYQVNLTQRLEARANSPPRAIFGQLLAHISTGFMAFLQGPDFAIHSASPERFIRVNKGMVETFPIKGTRRRTKDPALNAALRRELLASQKDAAELNMITDLLRNDLGKICKTESVRVISERDILDAPNVMHTFSHIKGQLSLGSNAIEALLGMFPGGSITGCPKKRAMEIIDELEPVTRSVYCGSIIAIEPNGNLDSSIAIRTIIQKGNRLVLSVGGGIVHGSDGNEEYQESLDKAQALINALHRGQ